MASSRSTLAGSRESCLARVLLVVYGRWQSVCTISLRQAMKPVQFARIARLGRELGMIMVKGRADVVEAKGLTGFAVVVCA
jgi:hypothetical protein